MSWTLTSSHVGFDLESSTVPPTVRFSYTGSSPGPDSRVRSFDELDYSFALEDLADLSESAPDHKTDDVVPSAQAISFAATVIRQIAGVFPPPEVTARENGTVLLLWHDERGFISVEIGEHEFGLVSSRTGYPSVHINAMNSELQRELPRPSLPTRHSWSNAISRPRVLTSFFGQLATTATHLVPDVSPKLAPS